MEYTSRTAQTANVFVERKKNKKDRGTKVIDFTFMYYNKGM